MIEIFILVILSIVGFLVIYKNEKNKKIKSNLNILEELGNRLPIFFILSTFNLFGPGFIAGFMYPNSGYFEFSMVLYLIFSIAMINGYLLK